MGKIVVIGSLNMDLVANAKNMPKMGETVIGHGFKQVSGGKGANQAVAIARLGGNVHMVGKVGDDGFGEILIENLEKDGVLISSVGIEKKSTTGVALITVDEKGNNTIVVVPGANFNVKGEDIDQAMDIIKESQIMVLQLEVPLDTVKYSLIKGKEYGKFTILNPAPAQKLDEEIIKNVDLLIPNETELEVISGMEINGEEDIVKACKSLMEKGVKQLIVTLGEKGSIYVDHQGTIKFPAHGVLAVDTTAAGDSFIGAVSVALSKGESMEDAIAFASKVGALTVTKEGAQSSIPYLIDVLNFKEMKR